MAVTPAIELDSSALRSAVAFTGRLGCMTREAGFEVVRSHGGTPSPTVTRQTNVLIVGELVWPLLDDGRPSNKLSKAGSYGIPVVGERRFLEWIGKAIPDSWNKTYSTDQIATLSKLSHGAVEELVRFGLLNPRGGLFGFRAGKRPADREPVRTWDWAFRDHSQCEGGPGMASRSRPVQFAPASHHSPWHRG
jgi:BRCA1 C Terminus (BRCT) domain